MKCRQNVLVAKCLPVQYSLRQRSLHNNGQEGFSRNGFQCIHFVEASVSQDDKGLLLHLFLVFTAEAQILGKALPVADGAPSVLHQARCLPLQGTRASHGSFQVPRFVAECHQGRRQRRSLAEPKYASCQTSSA
jgi:hypothetical protein